MKQRAKVRQPPSASNTRPGALNTGDRSQARIISAAVQRLLPWFAATARDLPWRRTRDPYAIWISEIMLQQTQVNTVVPYWERWMRELPTVESLARSRPERVLKLWEGLGYYTRARNLQKAAQHILSERRGQFPTEFTEVLALPGIGRYTAGAICSIAFNQPAPVLDGNVIRVLARLFGIQQDPREKHVNARLWTLAAELVARASGKTPNACSHLNQALMELGALVCTPRRPNCDGCPLARQCAARREESVEDIPSKILRPKAVPRHFAALVACRDGRYLVRQRPAGAVNAGLWEFPNVELRNGSSPAEAICELLATESVRLKPVCTVKHSIMHYRITLEAFAMDGPQNALASGAGAWRTPAQLRLLPFSGAHAKILQRLRRFSPITRFPPDQNA